MTKPQAFLFLALTCAVLLPATLYAVKPVNASRLTGVAIKGYDPVAYFTESKPVKGSADFQTTWQGAKWRFASADNLAIFQSAPEKYAPQYGGYCAWAVSQNSTAGIDPAQWTILNGKLYLNYSRKVNARWQADRANFIKLADQHWPKLVAKK